MFWQIANCKNTNQLINFKVHLFYLFFIHKTYTSDQEKISHFGKGRILWPSYRVDIAMFSLFRVATGGEGVRQEALVSGTGSSGTDG